VDFIMRRKKTGIKLRGLLINRRPRREGYKITYGFLKVWNYLVAEPLYKL